ncbi:MAG: tetratricopeptide repeat protein [Deltaproteobacteria bacterium]|nr:tetratricopeptide repeat protein [Deltaproteobacteria bacterium]
MSYIHDALKKAQKEKDSLYRNYAGVITAAGSEKKRGGPLRISIAGILSIVLALAALSLLGYSFSLKGEKVATAGVEQNTAVSMPAAGEVEKVVPATPEGAEENAAGTAAIDDVVMLYEDGLEWQRAGDLLKAEVTYRKVLEIDPTFSRALNNLGVIAMAGNRNAEALMLFERAREAGKGYVDPAYNMACLYARMGRVGDAMENLKEAVRLDESVLQWAQTDPDLAKLRSTVDYREYFTQNRGG